MNGSDMSTPSTRPLEPQRQFTKIPGAPSAYLSKPRTSATSLGQDPTLVLICGWMDAKLPHLYKYTETYDKLYPAATQILLRLNQDYFWKSRKSSVEELLPVAEQMEAFSDHRILVHVFSNGGCFSLITLADAICETRPSPQSAAIPAEAIIFDSCPGDSNLRRGVHAFSAGIRNPIAKWAAACFFWAFLGLMLAYNKVLRRPDLFKTMAKRLQDGSVIPHKAVRTYIYSTADQIIREEAVERHALEAKVAGMDVRSERYTTTAHVNHMKENPRRYLSIVQSTWGRGNAR